MEKADFVRLEDKVDKISDKIGAINVTLAEQHVTLKEHTRRSLANEDAVKILSSELKPVFAHVSVMNAIAKLSLAIVSSSLIWEIVKWASSK